MDTPLVKEWRERAETLREYGAEGAARALEAAASDLEEWWHEWWLETIDLQEAADESPLAYGTLQRKVSGGEIPNVGEKHSPRIRRCDLPSIKTPDRPGPSLETGEPDVVEESLRASSG